MTKPARKSNRGGLLRVYKKRHLGAMPISEVSFRLLCDGNRTRDSLLIRQKLYQLSYAHAMVAYLASMVWVSGDSCLPILPLNVSPNELMGESDSNRRPQVGNAHISIGRARQRY